MTTWFDSILAWFDVWRAEPHPGAVKLLWTIAVFLGYFLVRRAVSAYIARRVTDVSREYALRKACSYLTGIVGLILLVKIWIGGLSGLTTYFGILSAGIAIALRDPLTNLAGWLFIAIRKPFVVGDRVQIGAHAGDVIDLRPFAFTVVEIGNWVDADQSSGRIIHIPNGVVFQESVANYTQAFNFIWNELPITVTFESNWEKAKEVLLSIAQEHTAVPSEQAAQQVRRAARKFLIFFQHLTPIVWTRVVDHGVTLTIRYLCEPRKRRSSEAAIWEAVLKAFAVEKDIDFAYPTQRFFDHAHEGKSGGSTDVAS